MNTKLRLLLPPVFRTRNDVKLFFIASVAIIAGFCLSIISWMEICSQECTATHTYRLYGFKFEQIGLVFFPLLFFFHIYSLKHKDLTFIPSCMLASAVGAEVIFIHAQKVLIGHWCPVCLSIAACVVVASICYLISYVSSFKFYVNESLGVETMINLRKGILTTLAVIAGFTAAFFGLGKVDALAAAEHNIQDSVAFGNLKSDVDVYFFSDWQCPACRQVEDKLHDIVQASTKDARLTFVDFTIHPSSLNFTPYNLSFMIHNKGKYVDLRDGLTKISIDTDAPTDKIVEQMAEKVGVHYKQLNYSDVALGMKYFKTLGEEFDINSTPTVVIVNEKTKKGKKLFGVAEIVPENITKAIEKLSEK